MTKNQQKEQKEFLDNDGLELKEEVRQHLPYILNGELYRIESQTGDNVTVRCCHCPPDRIYRGSVRSTGNFHMHIKRRHASLLGKLHEMKVAALVERRDRIFKNRVLNRSRKKTTTPTIDVSATAPSETKNDENHELKIKTVFQRHQQEHHKQEEAAMRSSSSVCESVLETESTNNHLPMKDSITKNDNIKHQLQEQPIFNPVILETVVSSQNGVSSRDGYGLVIPRSMNALPVNNIMVTLPRYLPYNLIKPEQQTPTTLEPEAEAIDLSRSTSLPGDENVRSINNVQVSQELSEHVNCAPNDILLQHIDNTLSKIKEELQTRNYIEQKRLRLDVAKFNYLHPDFKFDGTH